MQGWTPYGCFSLVGVFIGSERPILSNRFGEEIGIVVPSSKKIPFKGCSEALRGYLLISSLGKRLKHGLPKQYAISWDRHRI